MTDNPITRARSLSKLARTDYDRKLVQGMIQDGLDDDTIRAVLGYQKGEEPDPQVMPGSFDVETQDEEEDPSAPALQEAAAGPASGKPQKPGKADGNPIHHLVGLLQHFTK